MNKITSVTAKSDSGFDIGSLLGSFAAKGGGLGDMLETAGGDTKEGVGGMLKGVFGK